MFKLSLLSLAIAHTNQRCTGYSGEWKEGGEGERERGRERRERRERREGRGREG